MAGFNDQRLVVPQLFQVFFDQAVLQPVLAHAACLAVGDQLIGVEGHVKIQVVVDHHLEGLALDAVALVFIDGLATQRAFRTVPVGIDAAPGLQLFQKFGGQLLVELFGHIAQGVHQGQLGLGLGQAVAPVRRPADAFYEFGVFRQLRIQLDLHGFADLIVAQHG